MSLRTRTRKDPLEVAQELKKALKNRIYGQKIAIEAVVDSVKSRVIPPDNMPQQIYFFLGPPATGKTYMAKTIAENFEGYKFFEVSMTDFQSHNDGQYLFGVDRGYNSESTGALTTFVKNNPKTVILFDEFEKAHNNIQKRLLPLLSEGYLHDSLGWIKDGFGKEIVFNSTNEKYQGRVAEIITKVDFTQTVVVFTSNLGSQLYNNHEFLDAIDDDYFQAETMIMQTLSTEKKKEGTDGDVQAIVPEMLSRLSQGKIVLFNQLKMRALRQIATDVFNYKVRELVKAYDLKVNFNSRGIAFIQAQLLKFAPNVDIRRVKAKIYEQFTDKLTDYLLSKSLRWKDIAKIDIVVSDEVELFNKKHILPGIKKGTLLKHLFRKNLSLELTDSVSRDGDVLTYHLEKVSFKKVKKAEDLVGSGAISFDVPSTSFDDVDGHIEPIKRLKEIAGLLKNPEKLKHFDASLPKGMLLYGAPGTGKTMLAEAFANYADLPFIATTANDLIDFSSNGYESMKTMFNRAKDYAPSIIFIDEIDTFGDREDSANNAPKVNELITQINGFSSQVDETVFIIAATNYKERIDSAILRPGRIELHVEIPTLDKVGREAFIKRILEKPSEPKIDVKKLVMYTAGMTGAQLEKIANESALYAIRNGLDKLSQESIIEQINIEKYGKRVVSKSVEDELNEVAYHEAGHAVVSYLLMPRAKIEQITITARERALGFVAFNLENSSTNLSKVEMKNHISVALAGRIAQIKEFGEDGLDSGAVSDLENATQSAYRMIAIYGMDEELGYINLNSIRHSDMQKYTIDKKVSTLMKELEVATVDIVENNWKKIKKVAQALLKKEVIHEDELEKLIGSVEVVSK